MELIECQLGWKFSKVLTTFATMVIWNPFFEMKPARSTSTKTTRIKNGKMKAPQQLPRTFGSLVFGSATLLLFAWSHSVTAQEVRTWVDSSGQFKIEAAYEKYEGDNVFLKLATGDVKQIPFSMLSAGDQTRVLELNAPAQPTVSDKPQPSSTTPIAPPPTVAPADEVTPAELSARSQEVRTWVDSSGQFKIEAAFEKTENETVFLKLPDGQVKQIPFSMLSDGDKDRIRKLNAPSEPEEPAVVPTTSVAAAPSSTMPGVPRVPPPSKPITTPPVPPKASPSISPPPLAVDPAPRTVDSPQQPEDSALQADDLTTEDLKPPQPVIHYSKRIGDLDIGKIEPPKTGGGKRANPKYLLAVTKSDLATLPREFQGAAYRLLDEPIKPREAVPALDYLKTNWPENRQPVLIKLVINCASSDHKFNRESALEILSNRDSDQSFPYIFARVDDTSFTIRSMAYQMLRQIGDRRAIEPLAKRFATDDVDRIASLLRSFGSASERAVIPYLENADADIRLRASNLLGKIGTEKSLPALQEMAQREQTMVLKAQTRSSINKIKRRTTNGS
jgi:hypothetical protein